MCSMWLTPSASGHRRPPSWPHLSTSAADCLTLAWLVNQAWRGEQSSRRGDCGDPFWAPLEKGHGFGRDLVLGLERDPARLRAAGIAVVDSAAAVQGGSGLLSANGHAGLGGAADGCGFIVCD